MLAPRLIKMLPEPAIRTKLSTDFTREEVKRLTMSSISCRLHHGCFLNWCSFDRRLFNWCSFDRRLFHGRLLNRCFFHGRFFHGCFFDRRFFDWRSFDRRLFNWCVFDWWRFAFNWHLIVNRCRFSEILLLRNKTPTANFLEQGRDLCKPRLKSVQYCFLYTQRSTLNHHLPSALSQFDATHPEALFSILTVLSPAHRQAVSVGLQDVVSTTACWKQPMAHWGSSVSWWVAWAAAVAAR